MSLGADYFNMGTKNIVINKFAAGKYEESSKIDNSDINENQNPAEKYTETVSNNNIDKALKEPEKVQMLSEKSQETQKTLGKPIKAELTAYSNDPRCSGQWESQTAMQTKTRIGVIAAPSKIPLGSKIYIPELKNYKADGMFDVEDRGGAIKIKKDGTYVIDVWVSTYEEAVKFGRKKTTIYLVE
ncbi:3D domain-containing protein [Clostridium chromiireducens]|uniref:3D domain-containing protein n=1 Tax=Clostridium chromiireducens TaxID=225345 RepID=UPI003AF9429B